MGDIKFNVANRFCIVERDAFCFTHSMARTKSGLGLDFPPKIESDFVEPMLALLVQRLPAGEEWSYEMKLDGYRCIASKSQSGIQLLSRRNNSFNRRFPMIAMALEGLQPGTILDGEVVALDESGRPSFNLLQNYRSKPRIYFYVFDILAHR